MSGRYKVRGLARGSARLAQRLLRLAAAAHLPGPRQVETTRLRERIRHEFARSRQTYGSPRLALAQAEGRRNRIARLMRQERLFARQRSKYRVATTDSRHGGPIAPNRLQQFCRSTDEVWVTDATGVLTGQGWLYVVALLDVYTRRIVGWSMGDSLDTPLLTQALQMALVNVAPPPG